MGKDAYSELVETYNCSEFYDGAVVMIVKIKLFGEEKWILSSDELRAL